MPDKKVDLVLSNPWPEPGTDKVHDVNARISVASELAERLVTGGIAVRANAAAAKARKSRKSTKATAVAKPAPAKK